MLIRRWVVVVTYLSMTQSGTKRDNNSISFPWFVISWFGLILVADHWFVSPFTPLKNVARGYFLIPAELISSHLQSLVNIRPSLARQSHTRVMMIRCNYQTLFYVKGWWSSTGHKQVLHFWKEGTQGFSIGNQGPSVVSKGNHQYHHKSDQRNIDS